MFNFVLKFAFVPLLWFTNLFLVDQNLISVFSLGGVSVLYFFLLRKNKELENSLRKDPLTGAFNRRALDEKILKGASVLLVDIDFFKKINDIHGHKFGDFVLQELVKFLENEIRSSDEVFRLGGEEFVVLLPNTKKSVANEIGNRLRESIKKETFSDGEASVNITISIGLLEVPQKSSHFQEVYEMIDEALYRAKENGRDLLVSA